MGNWDVPWEINSRPWESVVTGQAEMFIKTSNLAILYYKNENIVLIKM